MLQWLRDELRKSDADWKVGDLDGKNNAHTHSTGRVRLR